MLNSSQLEDLIKNSQQKEAELQVGSTDSNQMSLEYLSCFKSNLVVWMIFGLCFVGFVLVLCSFLITSEQHFEKFKIVIKWVIFEENGSIGYFFCESFDF